MQVTPELQKDIAESKFKYEGRDQGSRFLALMLRENAQHLNEFFDKKTNKYKIPVNIGFINSNEIRRRIKKGGGRNRHDWIRITADRYERYW